RNSGIDRGGEDWIDAASSPGSSPWKGLRRVIISYSVTPNEKMSDRTSAARPSNCSGAIYRGVPAIVDSAGPASPASDSAAAGSAIVEHLDMPKSTTFTALPADMKMLAGLISRWTMPLE